MGDIAWAAWLLVALVLLGAEALTMQFVLLYFGLGALFAAAVSPFAGGVMQGLVFAVAAVLLMVLTRRPLLAYARGQRDTATNVVTRAVSLSLMTPPSCSYACRACAPHAS